MAKSGKKYYLTVSTIVNPWLGFHVGQFCRWFKTESFPSFLGSPLNLYAKFGGNEITSLARPHFLDSDRALFDYQKIYLPFLNKNVDFVQFCAERDTKFSTWEFVVGREKLEEIWENSEKGRPMQLFDISVDKTLLPPNCPQTILRNNEQCSELLFQSERNGFLGYGMIEKHYSMSISKYHEITGQDPVFEGCQAYYYHPILYESYANKMSFNDYYEGWKKRFAEFSN